MACMLSFTLPQNFHIFQEGIILFVVSHLDRQMHFFLSCSMHKQRSNSPAHRFELGNGSISIVSSNYSFVLPRIMTVDPIRAFVSLSQLPPDIVTSGDELTIHFVSDDTIHRKGFHAKYQLDDEIVYDLPNE